MKVGILARTLKYKVFFRCHAEVKVLMVMKDFSKVLYS